MIYRIKKFFARWLAGNLDGTLVAMSHALGYIRWQQYALSHAVALAKHHGERIDTIRIPPYEQNGWRIRIHPDPNDLSRTRILAEHQDPLVLRMLERALRGEHDFFNGFDIVRKPGCISGAVQSIELPRQATSYDDSRLAA